MQGLLLQFVLLICCFRGNRAAFVLTRLLAGLYGGMYAVLVVIIASNRLPIPLHTGLQRADAAWSTGKILGIAFVCWALWASRSVRTFLQRQKARTALPPPLPA